MTEIFGRFDFDVIARWIREGERVLDLGCGDGSLLKFLQAEKGIRGYGVENDPGNVLAAIRNGVNVLQFDLEQGLQGFDDDSFDHVIMSLSLQTVRHTVPLVQEMLRVGHEAVVSFPNFGYWRHRQSILNGRIAVTVRRSPAAACRCRRRCPISGTTRRTYASSRLPISRRSVPTTASSCTRGCSSTKGGQ